MVEGIVEASREASEVSYFDYIAHAMKMESIDQLRNLVAAADRERFTVDEVLIICEAAALQLKRIESQTSHQ